MANLVTSHTLAKYDRLLLQATFPGEQRHLRLLCAELLMKFFDLTATRILVRGRSSPATNPRRHNTISAYLHDYMLHSADSEGATHIPSKHSSFPSKHVCFSPLNRRRTVLSTNTGALTGSPS